MLVELLCLDIPIRKLNISNKGQKVQRYYMLLKNVSLPLERQFQGTDARYILQNATGLTLQPSFGQVKGLFPLSFLQLLIFNVKLWKDNIGQNSGTLHKTDSILKYLPWMPPCTKEMLPWLQGSREERECHVFHLLEGSCPAGPDRRAANMVAISFAVSVSFPCWLRKSYW